MTIDIEKLRAELRAGLAGVTPGPWGVDGYDIDGPIGNGDYVVLGEAWSSHETQTHLARCSPDNIAALLDALDAATARAEKAERERDEAREDARAKAFHKAAETVVELGWRLSPEEIAALINDLAEEVEEEASQP